MENNDEQAKQQQQQQQASKQLSIDSDHAFAIALQEQVFLLAPLINPFQIN